MPRLALSGGVMVVDSLPIWLSLLGLMLHLVFRLSGVHLAVRVKSLVTGLLKSYATCPMNHPSNW